jgi:hypothetical protein
MTDLIRLNNVAKYSFTDAAASLGDTTEIQHIDILGDLQGAPAFGTVNPGPNGIVVVNGVKNADGSLPHLAALGTFVRLAWGKAIINVEQVKQVTIQNLLLTDAAMANDSNGAAIRINGGCKEAYIKNVIARGNENGMLTDGAEHIVIEDSLFDNNGQASNGARQGYSHNGYYNGTKLEIRRSTYQNSEYGHDLKSRMKITEMEQSRFEGSKHGRAFDLSNGGIWNSKGNEYIKHADAEQNNLIHIRAEGKVDDRPEAYTSTNDLFQIDIEANGRALQFINHGGDAECLLIDPKFVLAGKVISDGEAANYLMGNVRIKLTGGPRGPLLPVGRQADAQATPTPPPQEQAPEPAAPTPDLPSGTWVYVGKEGEQVTLVGNGEQVAVRYGAGKDWITKIMVADGNPFVLNNDNMGGDPVPNVPKFLERLVPSTTAPTPDLEPLPTTPVTVSDNGLLEAALVHAAIAFLTTYGFDITEPDEG